MRTKKNLDLNNSISIGAVIKRLRHERAISQGELAKKAGLSQSAITQIENTHRDPTYGTIRAIANALKVPVAMLIMESSAIVIDLEELKKIKSVQDLAPQALKDLFLLNQEIQRLQINLKN